MRSLSENFSPYWWVSYYTKKIHSAISTYEWKRKMGIATDADLSKSNEEIYQAIQSRNVFLSIIENQEAIEDEEFYSNQ